MNHTYVCMSLSPSVRNVQHDSPFPVQKTALAAHPPPPPSHPSHSSSSAFSVNHQSPAPPRAPPHLTLSSPPVYQTSPIAHPACSTPSLSPPSSSLSERSDDAPSVNHPPLSQRPSDSSNSGSIIGSLIGEEQLRTAPGADALPPVAPPTDAR